MMPIKKKLILNFKNLKSFIYISMNNTSIYTESFEGDYVLICKHIHQRFEEYAVKITHQEIMETLQNAERQPKELTKHIFRSVYRNLIKYSNEELYNNYTQNTEEWDNWCLDVKLFFCYRFILFNRIIPIAQMP